MDARAGMAMTSAPMRRLMMLLFLSAAGRCTTSSKGLVIRMCPIFITEIASRLQPERH